LIFTHKLPVHYFCSQLALLGIEKEKEDLEPWLTQEMDKCMSDLWLSGDEELFSQIFYFIMSENVSGEFGLENHLVFFHIKNCGSVTL